MSRILISIWGASLPPTAAEYVGPLLISRQLGDQEWISKWIAAHQLQRILPYRELWKGQASESVTTGPTRSSSLLCRLNREDSFQELTHFKSLLALTCEKKLGFKL